MPQTAVPSNLLATTDEDHRITVRCRVLPHPFTITSFRTGPRTATVIVNALVCRAERMVLIDREVRRITGSSGGG